MIYTSKFRKMYWFKILFIILTSIFLSTICLKSATTYNGTINFEYPPSWAGIFFLLLPILVLLSLLKIYRIEIDEGNIIFDYFILKKKKTFALNEIIKIERVKIQRKVRSGNISDGFHETTLCFYDGTSKTISPDFFENYNELIQYINSKFNS
jgi:hypothetical protein